MARLSNEVGIDEMTIRTVCFVILALLVVHGGSASAQFETNGANAVLTLQGEVPSSADVIGHNVLVTVPGAFTLAIDSGTNPLAGIIMLASLAELTGPQFPTPLWSQSIDVGDASLGASSIVVVGDGISLSVNAFIDSYFRTDAATNVSPFNDFALSLSVNSFFCGGRSAWQAIVADVTNPPIFIDNTEAGDANFVGGQSLTLLTGDDGAINVPFAPGDSFAFHGVNYSDVWVSGNGYVNFGSASTLAFGGFAIDAVGFANAEPAIAVALTDWGIGNTGINDGVYYRETTDASGGCRMLISWGDTRGLPSGAPGVAHFADVDTNNQFEIVLRGDVDPLVNSCGFPAAGTSGDFRLRWPRLDPTAVTRPGDGVFGHTPGGSALTSTPASIDMLGTFTASGSGQAAIEEHNNTGMNQSVIGWDGAGAARAYNNFLAAAGVEVDFLASTGSIPGDLGYVSVPTGAPADDVEAVLLPVFDTGGQLTIVGKFAGFGTGRVDITDASGATFLNLPTTVISGNGPLFTNEGLVVTYPPLAQGTATATVMFGGAACVTITVTFTVSNFCQMTSTFTLADDGFAIVPLPSPMSVTHYGVAYTTIYVTSNGTINMSAGHTDFTPTLPEFFGGNGTPGNSNVAVAFADLNLGGVASGASYTVISDSCTGEVFVNFDNQNWWNSGAPAGSFGVTLNWGGVADQILFDYAQMINDVSGTSIAIVGVGDGVLGGSDTDFGSLGGIDLNVPGYASSVGPDSIADAIPTTTIASRLNSINGVNGPGTFAVINSGVTGLLVAF